jgi:hypothetical protein
MTSPRQAIPDRRHARADHHTRVLQRRADPPRVLRARGRDHGARDAGIWCALPAACRSRCDSVFEERLRAAYPDPARTRCCTPSGDGRRHDLTARLRRAHARRGDRAGKVIVISVRRDVPGRGLARSRIRRQRASPHRESCGAPMQRELFQGYELAVSASRSQHGRSAALPRGATTRFSAVKCHRSGIERGPIILRSGPEDAMPVGKGTRQYSTGAPGSMRIHGQLDTDVKRTRGKALWLRVTLTSSASA